MKISNVKYGDIIEALRETNVWFSGNVIINTHSFLNQAGTRHTVTLRVRDSKEPGHRLGQSTTSKGNHRRLVNACWHVYGTFVDALFEAVPNAKVSNHNKKMVDRDDWYWHDWNIGSIMSPMYYSEACECD